MVNNVEALQFDEIEIEEGRSFPQDIVHHILSMLPTKSIVRFKSVCKNWHNMISTPEFDKVIFQYFMSKVMIIYGTQSSMNLFFKLKNAGLDCSLCFERDYVWAEKACENFVLFRCEPAAHGPMPFVYDTINHQYRQLPEIRAIDFQKRDICSLVYDASAKTCKVIVFHWEYVSTNYCSIYKLNPGEQNWRKRNWRTLKLPCSQKIRKSHSSIELNSLLYWIAESNYEDYGSFIQPMDIATEEFTRMIKLPCQPWSINSNLLKIKGSLCFMNTASEEDLHIWVLKDSVESLWNLEHRISFQSMVQKPNCLSSFMNDSFHPWLVVDSTSTTYLLVTINDISAPYWYNMVTKELRQIAVDYNNLEACYLHNISFIDLGPELELLSEESLLLPVPSRAVRASEPASGRTPGKYFRRRLRRKIN